MIIVILLLLLLPWSSQAAQNEHAEKVVYKKHTIVDFQDDTIQGALSRPDGFYLESLQPQSEQRLIRIRRSFRQQMLEALLQWQTR